MWKIINDKDSTPKLISTVLTIVSSLGIESADPDAYFKDVVRNKEGLKVICFVLENTGIGAKQKALLLLGNLACEQSIADEIIESDTKVLE